MKHIFFTLGILIALTVPAKAGELYICIDQDGNSIVTDSPQQGMKKCVLKSSFENQEPAKEKDKTPAKKDDEAARAKKLLKEKEERYNNCVKSCDDKIRICYNYTANGRLCVAENEKCVAACKSSND